MRHQIILYLCYTAFLMACDDSPQKKQDVSTIDMSMMDQEILLDQKLDSKVNDQEITDQHANDQILDMSLEKSNIWQDISSDRENPWQIPELKGKGFVIYTEAKVPNVYAENEDDLAILVGFVLAKDRFFNIDLVRRLGLGQISSLLGDAALSSDFDSRTIGMRFVAQKMCAQLSPKARTYFENIALGMNAYIEQVRSNQLTPPSEYTLAGGLFNVMPVDLMKPWTVLDYCGIASVLMYQTNYETQDVNRTAQIQILNQLASDGNLREDAFISDIALNLKPLFHAPSIENTQEKSLQVSNAIHMNDLQIQRSMKIPNSALTNLQTYLNSFKRWFNRDRDLGFGSNAWAVSGALTGNLGSLTAGDGHLGLSAPSLMYQIGLNTKYLGGGTIEQKGLFITGLPLLAVGTNGKVAWSQVNPYMDVTDWYEEELQLDPQTGMPIYSLFKGEWRNLQMMEENIEVADRPALQSVGREILFRQLQTFDGKWIVSIEGQEVGENDPIASNEQKFFLQGKWVIPKDMPDDQGNLDGKIWAIAFDHVAFDVGSFPDALMKLASSQNIEDLKQGMKGFIGAGLFLAGGDDQGNILYSSYQAVPCRGNLTKNENGIGWVDGANPMMLIDGSQYGGFEMPLKENLIEIDEDAFDEVNGKCAIPFDQMPMVINPSENFVVTANNAPKSWEDDGILGNDDIYVGGTWDSVRAYSIIKDIKKFSSLGILTESDMSKVQSNHDSRLGELFTQYLLDDISYVKQTDPLLLSDQSRAQALQRAKSQYLAFEAQINQVVTYLDGWKQRGFQAESGVETFYHQPTDDQKLDAVATMIFNEYFRQLLQLVYADEIDVLPFDGSRMKVSALHRFFRSRGENIDQIVGFDEQTKESIFFDQISTDIKEMSFELSIFALTKALENLSAPFDQNEYGFGSQDMSSWLWGLRHLAKFESLLGPFLGNSGSFGVLLSQFSITTSKLPLMPNLSSDDPRKALKWFPRHGDQWNVDACNPGFGGSNFSCGAGPAMRMSISLHQGKVSGVNIIPGGQSGTPSSPYYKDQLALWLGNQALPLRFHVEEVLEGAISQDRFVKE